MEAYCVKCKEKREIQTPEAVFTATGTPATRGSCAVCGTNLFRMGRTDAHEGLTPPKVDPKSRKKRKDQKRSGKLVVVESPAKAKTIKKQIQKGECKCHFLNSLLGLSFQFNLKAYTSQVYISSTVNYPIFLI